MSASGLFLFIAFLAAVAIVLIWPFLQPRLDSGVPGAVSDSEEIIRLKAQHEAILKAIRDLDFDFQVGKLLEADYQSQRETLLQRAIETLKTVDTRESALIEAAVESKRGTRAQAS